MNKFVEDWNILQTLGEGAYAEVKLLVHESSGDCIAMKIVDLNKHKDAKICSQKEMKLHMYLVHPNIIRMLGKREDEQTVYMFLEYAVGGELFNKIEPDIGMPSHEARKYMRQLLEGLSYLFCKGIAHRDLKPENLLLDASGNLKISDFGMATIYRLKSKERLLDKKCGTLPYVAPEVLEVSYRAEPADIWSCGIIFVAMLAGELPWDEPTIKCIEYLKWKEERCIMRTPWNKLDNSSISLARKIINPSPKLRPSITQILEHPWMIDNSLEEVDGNGLDSNRIQRNIPNVALSQPMPQGQERVNAIRLAGILQKRDMCFSQPTQQEDMLVSSQLPLTQSPLTLNNFEKMIKRMTRFIVNTDWATTINMLCKILENLNFIYNSDAFGVFTVSTVDSRKRPLVFKTNMFDVNGNLLIDFRLNKGCGLEFKKWFMKIKTYMKDVIVKV